MNILSSRFTPGEIESHIESLPWNTYNFNYMNGLTFDFIEKHSNVSWDFNAMSRLLSFNLELATQRPELDWNWRSMSFNDNLTVEFAKKYLIQNGLWKHISSNSRITCHDIISNPDLPWDWDGISSNSNLTLSFIEQNKERLCFQKVSGCANLTCEFISRHFSRNWNWKRISRTIYISTHILQRYSHFPWSYADMSYNSNLTVDILYNFKDKEWDWFRVLKNEMQCTLHICAETKYYLERQAKTHEKNSTICDELLLAAFRPNRFYNWCLSIDQQKMIK